MDGEFREMHLKDVGEITAEEATSPVIGKVMYCGVELVLSFIIFCSGMGVGTIAGFEFISLTSLMFDLFTARRISSFSRTRSSSSSLRASRGGQMLPAGWNFRARFWISLVGMRSKICHEDGI